MWVNPSKVHIEVSSEGAHRECVRHGTSWAQKSIKVRINQKMRHCSTYLICLRSRAGMDVGVDEGLEARGLQSDRGPKKNTPSQIGGGGW